MCGIVGAIARDNVVPVLLEGLIRLEYRGYDSAGLVVSIWSLHRLRTTERVAELEKLARTEKTEGLAGIAHTRWATHGAHCERNAHPHFSGNEKKITIVHNGIIENHEAIRQRLQKVGFEFLSDTDTEVIAHLVSQHLGTTHDLLDAVFLAVAELRGAYAIAVIDEERPDRIIVARNGAPLLLGLGENGNYAASDASALLQVTRRMIYLEEGDVAELYNDHYRSWTCNKTKLYNEVTRQVR